MSAKENIFCLQEKVKFSVGWDAADIPSGLLSCLEHHVVNS